MLVRDAPAGSEMKGESSAMRSAATDFDVILTLSTDGYRDNTNNLTLIPTGGVSSSNIGTTGNGESLVCFGELYSKWGVKAARKHVVSVHEKQLTLGIDRRSDVCATMLKSPGVTVIDMGSWNGDPR